MTRRFWFSAAAIISLSLSGACALAQTVTPSPAVLTFSVASPVGVSGASIQKSTITFQITNGTAFIPATAVLHYGTSFSAGAINCTGTGNPNETCTVQISFVPSFPGGRRDALFLMNGTTRLATVLIYGVGQSPLALVQPGVITQPIKASPTGIFTSVVDENGTAYVLKTQTNAVASVTAAGVVTTLPITGLNSPRTIGIDGAGVLYISSDVANSSVTTYDTVRGTQGTFPVPNTTDIFPTIAVGNTGNIYEIDGTSNVLYTTTLAGVTSHQAFSPALSGPASMTVDGSEELFIGSTNTITEMLAGTPGLQTQNQITASNSQNGLNIDAASTLYATIYTGNTGVVELAASNYSTPLASLDGTTSPIGSSLGPDGTVYVGNNATLDKVDRTQGLVAFGNNTIGNQTIQIYNGGNQSLTVSNIAITGSTAFTLSAASTNNCTGGTTIPPGAFCQVVVTYSTTHAGVFTGTLSFTDNSLNSAASTQNVAITAEFQGIYVTASPALLNFGNQQIGTVSAAQPVTLTNNGDFYAATIALPQNTGPFNVVNSMSAPCGTLAVGASCTLMVSFAPTLLTQVYTGGTTALDALASFQFGTMPVPFFVNATAINPTSAVASFAPGSLAFGTQNINTTSPTQALLLTNTGTAQLNLTSISITGTNFSNFSETNTCGGGVAPAASCTINVSFSPTVVGPYSATVSVVDNAAVSPTTAALTGTGVSLQVPQLQFNPLQLNAIAGTGVGKVIDTGDGGPALQATFNTPEGVVQDAAGNIYVSDQDDNYVRKIDTSGNITAFAGTPSSGSGGFSGDNGQATAATLSQPIGLAIDGAGNVYIADYGNARIRKVVPSTGVITTYAGVGNGFFNGGPATTVPLPGPTGIAFDAAGNLYVACTNQQIIAKITPGTTPNTSLFAGVQSNPGPGVNSYNGDNQLAINADLNFPQDVAADQAGNIYIADTVNARIRMVAASTGIITTVAGNGTPGNTGDNGAATSAQINANGIATDLAGELFITTGTSIRKVDIHGNISTYAGGGSNTVPGPSTSVALVGLGLPRVDRYGSLIIPGFHPYDGVLSAGPNGILVFPNQTVGTTSAPQTVLFENTGDATLTLSQTTYTATGNFNVTGGTCTSVTTLAPNATCTLTVTFSPASAVALTGSIPVASNSGASPQSIALQGTGTPAAAVPQAVLSPSPLTFPGTTNVGQTTTLPVTLTNPGSAVLNINNITIGGTNASSFAQTNSCSASLGAGLSCTINIAFTPATATAGLTATLSVSDNATGSPQTITLTGSGTAAAAPQATLNPNPVNFPSTNVGSSSQTMTMSLGNPGNATLNITSISITGANAGSFSQTNNCGTTLQLDSSCIITITFTPTTSGALTANISVADNATGSPQTAVITGTGTGATAPQAVLTPNPLAFPSATVGTPTTLPLVLSNPGSAVLNVNTYTVTGANASNFTFTNGCSASLSAGQNCTLMVTFTPTSAGPFTAALSVSDNATGSPQIANLTGTGTGTTSSAFTVNSSTPTASVQPGGVAQYNLTVAPLGGTYNNLVTLSATGLPVGATASFAPPAVTPGSAGAPSVLSIQTPSLLARDTSPHSPVPLLAVLAGVQLLGLTRLRHFRKVSRRWMLLAIAVLALLPALALTGCNGGYFGPAPRTFTITVVGTSGSLQESTTVSLTVQ